jgi:DNA polymerase elongation subunit (family B)
MIYYTYYKKIGDKLYFRFIDEEGNDKSKIEKIPMYLFFPVKSNKETKYKGYPSLINVQPKKYKKYREYEEDKQNAITANMNVYGFPEDLLYLYNLYKENKDKLTQQFNKMKILAFDIEVYTGIDNSVFPKAEDADFPISVITFKEIGKNKQYFTFTTKEFKTKEKNIKKCICKDEKELLLKVIEFLSIYKPHVLTGWNIIEYDLLYILNRIKKLFPLQYQSLLYKLIPFKIDFSKIKSSSPYIDFNSLKHILGISILDYMEIYKKFSFKNLPSFSLDYVSKHELGEGKISYNTEYKDLTELYENNFDLYIEYNIQDVNLIDLLEEKTHLLKLVFNFSYLTFINFEDAQGTIKPAANLLMFYMYKKGLIPSILQNEHNRGNYPGGFVKQPKKGEYFWVAVFDITSSYPNQIRSYNISLETLIPNEKLPDELKKLKQRLLNKFNEINANPMEYEELLLDLDFVEKEITPLLKKYNVIMTPSLDFYTKDFYGIIPEMISDMFNERLKWKKLEKEYKKQLKGE